MTLAVGMLIGTCGTLLGVILGWNLAEQMKKRNYKN